MRTSCRICRKLLRAGKQLLALINDNFHSVRALDRPAAIAVPPEEYTTPKEQELVAEAFSESATAAELAPGAAQGFLLVVDDIEANRDMLSRRLERQGYVVATAENGRQALEMLRAETFDLVLLDVMMPEMDGYEVLHRLKADEALRNIPVIMISALSELDSVGALHRDGRGGLSAQAVQPDSPQSAHRRLPGEKARQTNRAGTASGQTTFGNFPSGWNGGGSYEHPS